MEHTYHCGVLADDCVTYRIHAIIGHHEDMTLIWKRKKDHPNKPTLVVCPDSLFQKTYDDLYDQLGASWRVYKYKEPAGRMQHEISFDPRHDVYHSREAGRTVIVVTLNQLQRLDETKNRQGLFFRIMIDEAQTIRYPNTKQAKVLRSSSAPNRFLYTGSLVVDTIMDIAGYLAFLEFPSWSDDNDKNLALVDRRELPLGSVSQRKRKRGGRRSQKTMVGAALAVRCQF